MRYQVPQFIEIEDKVIGPFTIKQFIFVVGGAGLSFVIYTFVNLYIALPLIAGVEALSLALAFYKINNKPFIDFLESAFTFYTKKNLYIWKKEDKAITATELPTSYGQVNVPKMADSKLKDLTWSLGVKENINPAAEKEGGDHI